MIGPNWFDRDEALRRLADDPFDVLVVGGGITGVGVALDAASRGLRTALVERDDFSSGTSSKSSKLAHGGLRYLQQGEIRLVYQALHERQRLRHNAPHLVKLLPFLLPVFTGRGGVIPKKLSRALGLSMWMYDLTGGARIGGIICNSRNVDRELDLLRAFAKELGTKLLYYVPRDNIVQRAEINRKTVIEYAPDSKQAHEYEGLAQAIVENEDFTIPTPMTQGRLEDILIQFGLMDNLEDDYHI